MACLFFSCRICLVGVDWSVLTGPFPGFFEAILFDEPGLEHFSVGFIETKSLDADGDFSVLLVGVAVSDDEVVNGRLDLCLDFFKFAHGCVVGL